MARTNIPIQIAASFDRLDDIAFTAANATDDMEFNNDGRTVLIFKNADVSSHVATVKSVATAEKRTRDITLTAAASKESMTTLLRPDLFNTGAGKVDVDLEAGEDTSTSFAAVKLAGA